MRGDAKQSRLLAACERIGAGRLRLITPEGATLDFGQGPRAAEIEIYDWSAARSLLHQSPEGMAESFARGLWNSEDPEALASLFALNRAAFPVACDRRFLSGLRRQNEAKLPGTEFFQLFLDPGMSFTGALFQTGDDDLGRAQHRKYDRVLDRLGDAPRLLDMNCGWGGLAERAVSRGHVVTAQAARADQRAFADARLDGRATVHLAGRDKAEEVFDGIAAIEPAGSAALPGMLASLKARLAGSGRAVLQSVIEAPGDETRLAAAARHAGLATSGRYAFGSDYARTLRQWSHRLEASAPRARRLGFTEDVLRHWRWRFNSAAAAFALGHRDVVQLDLAHA
ncbi:class I SAM-dependent methyltransferase [Pseudoroseicyclus sp. H15]